MIGTVALFVPSRPRSVRGDRNCGLWVGSSGRKRRRCGSLSIAQVACFLASASAELRRSFREVCDFGVLTLQLTGYSWGTEASRPSGRLVTLLGRSLKRSTFQLAGTHGYSRSRGAQCPRRKPPSTCLVRSPCGWTTPGEGVLGVRIPAVRVRRNSRKGTDKWP